MAGRGGVNIGKFEPFCPVLGMPQLFVVQFMAHG